jgi:hypothetical protein
VVLLKREAKKRVAASQRGRGVRESTPTRRSAPTTTLLDTLAGRATANTEDGESSDGRWFMDASGMVEDEQRLLESADEEYTYLSIHRIRRTWEGPRDHAVTRLAQSVRASVTQQRLAGGEKCRTN